MIFSIQPTDRSRPLLLNSHQSSWKYLRVHAACSASISNIFRFASPGTVPFQEDVKKPRLVYATGIRLGLIRGLTADQVIPTERFYAGGGTTVRGFKQDGLGPLDAVRRSPWRKCNAGPQQ